MKKVLALLLAVSMLLGLLAGCGSDTGGGGSTDTGSTGTDSGGSQSSDTGTDAPAAGRDVVTVEFFNVAANYQGMQTGWFAKVLMDNLALEMNIIAPQVAGAAVYQTRASTGELGDLILLEAVDFADSVQAGLIKDISADIQDLPYLMEYWRQIENLNNGLPGTADGTIYGIPTEMANTSPTSYSQNVIYSSPMLRWDLYSAAGAPDIADLDGLLDVLEVMMQNNPTNADGDPAYPFSLWPDWDGGDGMLGIANVVQLTTWYGEKIKGSAILKPDDTFIPLTDKAGSYYKILRFLNSAFNRGLVDPDSGTQDWGSAVAKMSAGQVYLMWYSWQVGFWNTQDRLTDGNGFIFVPVEDQLYYADSDPYYGSGRIFGVGAHVEGEKYERILEFLNWYASPEGVMYQHNGLEGFTYEWNEEGTLYLINDNALMDNLPVPEEFGGGGYSDGNNAINQWIVWSNNVNPLTGEPYANQYWSSYIEATMTDMKREWQDRFNAPEPVDYMKDNNVLLVSPNVSVSLPSDDPDISIIRNQCNDTLCDASWRMIFASPDAFDGMWDSMASQLEGFGFNELYAFDVEKHQIEVDAKNAAK